MASLSGRPYATLNVTCFDSVVALSCSNCAAGGQVNIPSKQCVSNLEWYMVQLVYHES